MKYKKLSKLSVVVTLIILFIIISTPHDNALLSTNKSLEKQNIARNSLYPVNDAGQTYGSAAKATSIEEEPDLILAEGVGGVEGYVSSSDLNADIAKSPQEAVKIMKMKNKSSRFIPLYKWDGKTVIGIFKIGSGQGNYITDKETEDQELK
ncbi:hypothetical protein [Inediibacterium massiliense]|uniref:hypothetical protein n=1 Tax=Inediibacterium massiliense TaxID=1658111 RepID=UPI0006B40164|nr:hypothetical protein [Inediibacterium massiliense]